MILTITTFALAAANPKDLSEYPARLAEMPCERIRYFGRDGQLTIGGEIFTKQDVNDVVVSADSFTEEPVLIISFTNSGAIKFRASQKGGIGNPMPICVGRETVSSPILHELVEGSSVQISGAFDDKNAQALLETISKGLD